MSAAAIISIVLITLGVALLSAGLALLLRRNGELAEKNNPTREDLP